MLIPARTDTAFLALAELDRAAYTKTWRKQNPVLAAQIAAYRSGGPRPELGGNRFGNALILLEDLRRG